MSRAMLSRDRELSEVRAGGGGEGGNERRKRNSVRCCWAG